MNECRICLEPAEDVYCTSHRKNGDNWLAHPEYVAKYGYKTPWYGLKAYREQCKRADIRNA